MGLAEEFAKFGASGRNKRWSWSARSKDGKTVVITLWKDQVTNWKSRPIVYDTFGKRTENWRVRAGNRERIENLAWARDHCAGRFRVVIVEAKDPNSSAREISRCFAQPNLIMQITDFDQSTGEFRAESI